MRVRVKADAQIQEGRDLLVVEDTRNHHRQCQSVELRYGGLLGDPERRNEVRCFCLSR